MVNAFVAALAEKVVEIGTENAGKIYEYISENLGSSEGCYYTKSGNNQNEGCLIGQAILQVQPKLRPALEALDNEDATGVMQMLARVADIDYYEQNLPTQKLIDKLVTVQIAQDDGEMWGVAIEELAEYLETDNE